MDGLCRLCGNEKENLSNIFDDAERTEKLASKIQNVLSIEIREDDDLPITICNTCTDELERTVSFIDRSHQAQEHLKQLHEVILLTKNEYADSISPVVSCSVSTDFTSRVSKPPEGDSSSIDEKDEYDADETYEPEFVESESSDFESTPTHNSSHRVETRSSRRIKSSNSYTDLSQRQEKLDAAGMDRIDDSSSMSDDSNREKARNILDRPIRENLRKSATKSTTNSILRVALSKKVVMSNSSNYADHLNGDSVTIATVDSSSNENQTSRIHPEDSNRQVSSCTTSKETVQNHEIDIKHEQSTNEQSNLRCEKCDINFDVFQDFEEHLFKEHPEDNSFSCKLCSSTFRKRNNLNLHLRTVHNRAKKDFNCSLCDYICGEKSRLMNHIKDVHEKNLHCSQCNYRTGTRHRLMRHIRNKHTPRDTTFVCEICGKTFEHRPSLLTHRKNAHFPEPHQCPECGVILSSLSKYLSHKYRCANDKPRFECDVCGASYALKAALMDHVNKHLNVRPYMCDFCGKSFFLRIRLNTHLFVHRGPQFKCDICGRCFNRKDNMKNHQKRQHTS